MRARGVNYDTGFINKGVSSRDVFDRATVRRELEIIATELHCNAVRLTGGDVDRLELAARIAVAAGLEVWFSPFTCDLSYQDMLDLLADCATRAERLRQQGSEVVFVTGAEISLLNQGFLPGNTLGERMALLADPQRLRASITEVRTRVNEFLSQAVAVVRERFGGRITYAAMPFEGVDWTAFDIIALDLYRSAEVADQFASGVRSLVAQGKPLAITEFGCATYAGAADKGARSGEIVVWDADTVRALRLDGEYIRDEQEQARYLRELLEVFTAAGVDSAFVFTFVQDQLPHRAPPGQDLDMAAYGIVKAYEDRRGATYPDMRWEPKAAFATLASVYRSQAAS